MKNKYCKLTSIVLVFLFCTFLKGFNTNAIYRESLDTTITLNITDSASTVSVLFDTHGGTSVSPNPVSRTINQPIGVLPDTELAGYNFLGWFTDASGGTKISSSTIVTGNVTYHAQFAKIVCKKAVTGTLHTETCNQEETTGCLTAGYQNDDTITYGTIPGENSPIPGDAYDCDVNNDGVYSPTTERFYYIKENASSEVAAFVYYASLDEFGATTQERQGEIYSYTDGQAYLPTSTTWSNSALQSFDGKASRYITLDDLNAACGDVRIDTNGELASCQYFMENTRFQSNTKGRSAIWLEAVDTQHYRIDSRTTKATKVGNTSSSSVRPVIEIPINTIEGYDAREKFTITYNANGGSFPLYDDELTHSVTKYGNQTLGVLPTPERTDYTFDGWYNNTNYDVQILSSTMVTGNATYYAKWILSNDYAARVNGVGYDTLQHAIDAVTANNTKTTVTLLKDVTENVTIVAKQNIEFDLQSYTISASTGFVMDNSGTIEIKNGTISSTSNVQAIYNRGTGDLTFSGGTITATGHNAIKSAGTANITGGTINSSAATAAAVDVENKGNVTISGGTINATGDRQAVYNNGGTLTITGTAYLHSTTDQRAAVHNKLGNLIITGGTIISDDQSGVFNEANLTIGADDGTISTTTPVIQGATYGVELLEVEQGTTPPVFNFYDGILKGQTAAIQDETLTTINSTTDIVHGTETISGDTYDTAYLVSNVTVYTVSFNAHGGTASFTEKDVLDGYEVGNLPIAEKTGFIFNGWYTSDTGGTLVTEQTVITSTITFHAQYSPACTVSFNADGGTASFSSKQVACGTAVGELPTATKVDYTFEGWYVDNTFATQITTATIINADVTYLAKWEYTVSVAVVDGIYYDTLQHAVDSVPTTGVKKVVTLLMDVEENIVVNAGKNIEFDLQNYTVSATSGMIIDNYGTIEIKNGTLSRGGKSDQMRVIENKSGGVVNITGGNIVSTAFQAIRNYGTMNITGGHITIGTSVDQGAVNNEQNAILNISGGEVIGTKRQAIYNDKGTVTVSGTVRLESSATASRATLQNANGTMTITGGTIISNTATYPAVLNNANMTIGTNNGTIDITTPVFQGKGYGLTISSGKTVTFYDGIIKGVKGAIDYENRVNLDTANNVTLGHGTEEIDGVTYNTAYPQGAITTYRITFNGNGGTPSLAYKDVQAGDPIGTLPTSEKTGEHFTGWFTEASGGSKITETTLINSSEEYFAHYSTTVCQKATTLHSNYGQLPTGDFLTTGDAYDCDVNGDGTFDAATERFYYLTNDNNGNAIMIYYNNITSNATPSCSATPVAYGNGSNNAGPTVAYGELPSTSEWSNVTLHNNGQRSIVTNSGSNSTLAGTISSFTYTDKSARFATTAEIEAACGINVSVNSPQSNELSSCNFLLENVGSSCNANYWLETPVDISSTNAFAVDSDVKVANTDTTAGVRPVIEVPLQLVEKDGVLVEFDTMSPAMRTYFDNISTWSAGQTDSSHSSYDASMTSNLNANDCVYFTGDNRDTEYLSTYCDQPNKYDTGVNGSVNVYEYDMSTGTRSSTVASYVTSNNGLLYNMIPNQVYYWESATDSSVNGYVKPLGERRIISIDNSASNPLRKIRNVRDLGGIPVEYVDENNQTVTGKIQYGRLFRGEKIWGGDGNTVQYFTKLGINHEMDLRANSEVNASTEDSLANKITSSPTSNTFEIIHYGIDYGGYDFENNHYDYYSLSRDALTEVMTEFVNAHNMNDDSYSLFFHCRIGADRTGTLAYLIEGILGVSQEDRYRDYELTVFFGLRERTRFYEAKGSNTIKFIHMKEAIRNATPNNNDGIEDVVAWYLQGSTNVTDDMALIQDFRRALIDVD